MGVGGIEEMSRGSAWRRFGVVVRARRLDDSQHMVRNIVKRPSIFSTIDETWALSVGLRRRRVEKQQRRGAVMLS